MALKCERCGEDIQEIDGFDSMERGLEYDYDNLCLDCWEELEEEDLDEEEEDDY
jgi:DNA-directed RNA polymerase subunit RPC12/RpoP